MLAGCLLSGGPWQRGPDRAAPTFPLDAAAFRDALPFEEVLAPLHRLSPARLSGEPGDAAAEETAARAASLLGASAGSSASGPHLLYHAHESSFSLLYDPEASKSSGSALSEYSLDYFLLNTGGSDAQINQAYCSVATLASVLNSLRYTKRFLEKGDNNKWSFHLPIDPAYDPYPYATQTDLLASACVRDTVIVHREGSDRDGLLAPPYGLGLEQAGKALACHVSDEWDVTVREVDPAHRSLSNVRFDLSAALIDPDARVMINYDRKGLGQLGGGHFSPLGAYDKSTDSFLILDVAKYKYPPVWVGANTLFSAMATVDKCGTWDYPQGQARVPEKPSTAEEYLKALELLNCRQKMRGYIILRKKG